jgi:putative redox protein
MNEVPMSERRVDLTKMGEGRYKATNARGGVVPVGSGHDPDFTPVELLLAALAGCGAIDIDLITGKRAEATSFDVTAEGTKIRDEQGNRLVDLRVTFDVRFPEGEAGDRAREVMPSAIDKTRDRLCTVGRTIKVGTDITYGEA